MLCATTSSREVCACRRRAVERTDDEDDDPDDVDDDQLDEEEGDNEVEAQAASMSRLGETSMLDSLPSKGEDALREVQRQRNLEQALFIQMEMQKKLHEQLEVILDTQLTRLSQLLLRCFCTLCLCILYPPFQLLLS